MVNKNAFDGLTSSGRAGVSVPQSAEIVALPLAVRLLACADKVGGKRALAEAAGLSESQLFRYLSGDSEMSAAKAVGLARAAEVDVGWLLTGEGHALTLETDGQPAFRAGLMEDILRVLTEVLVDFEWRLNPSQRAKYATYVYQALRMEETASGQAAEITPERLMEGLWYFGKSTFDELLDVHAAHLLRLQLGAAPTPSEANTFAQAVAQGHYQFYNSTGGDAINRWLGTQVSGHSAQRLLHLLDLRRQHDLPNNLWLDVGCGNGRELDYILRHAPELEVYGTEISRAALAQCHKFEMSGRWAEGSVLESDTSCLPFESGKMGMVYCRGVLHYLPELGEPDADYGLPRALREMVRVLAPSGLLALMMPLGVRPGITFHQPLDMAGLKAMLERLGLEILFEKDEHVDLAKPPYQHQGQIIAKKVR